MKIYSPLIEKAIDFALDIHEIQQQQKRKITHNPYITHLLSVAIILSRVTQDDEVIAAGILHDTIEDCDPKGCVTKEILELKFGKNVSQYVFEVTDEFTIKNFLERKREALNKVIAGSKQGQLIKSADLIHNMSDLTLNHHKIGDAIYNHFSGSKKEMLERYCETVEALAKVWPQNPLLEDLQDAFENFKKLQ